jgi:hypothetical protein
VSAVSLVVGVDVDAPPQEVWDAFADWESQGEWMLATQVRVTGQDRSGVGAQIEGRTGAGPVGVTDRMTVTGWDPPRLCVVRHEGRLIRGSGIFRVVDLGGGRSCFLWSEELVLPFGPLGRAGWPLARPLARAAMARSARRFASHVARRRT